MPELRRADDGPTLGEVVRRLDDVALQLGKVAQQLADMPERLDSTYVRRETYLVQHTADTKIAADLRTDLDAIVGQQRQNRMMVISALVYPILVAVMTFLIISGIQ